MKGFETHSFLHDSDNECDLYAEKLLSVLSMLHFSKRWMFDFGVWTCSLASLRNRESILNVLNPEKLQDANFFFFFFPLKQSWKLQMSSFAALFPALLPHLQYKETSSRLLFSCLYFKRLLFGVFRNSSGNAFKWDEWYRAVLTAKWTLHIPVESSLILFKKP